CGGSGTVVGGAFGKIPRVEMPANYEDLLGMFGAANFADDVGGLNRSVGEGVLHVEADARSDAAIQETFKLSLIFGRHGHDGDREVGIEAENSRMRQVHTRSLVTAL